MNQELSNQEKAKIFALYLGQQFVYEDNEPDDICGVYGDDVVYGNDADESGEGIFSISECKLILSPLSSISDEDALEIAEIITSPGYYIAQYEVFDRTDKFIQVMCQNKQGEEYGGSVFIYFNGDIDWDYHNKDKCDGHGMRLLQSYDYLREHGYALPYKGRDLFELGIAIPNKQTP